MRPGPGMGPRTHFHADTAVGSDLPPILKASISVNFPADRTIVLAWVAIFGNGFGWTTGRAFFADAAKVFDANILGFINLHGPIGQYSGKPYSGTILLGQQISHTTDLTQTGILSQGRQ